MSNGEVMGARMVCIFILQHQTQQNKPSAKNPFFILAPKVKK